MIGEMKWDTAFKKQDLVQIFTEHKDMFKNAGGDIETYLSKCKMIHSRRVFSLGKEHKFVITKEDLLNAIEYIKKNSKVVEDKPPWGMYT
jgi:hypothetical protein